MSTLQHVLETTEPRSDQIARPPENPGAAFAAARRRQQEMLGEVWRRLSEIAAETQRVELGILRAEREARGSEVRAAMSGLDASAGKQATDQLEKTMAELALLEDKRADLHARKQHLLTLESDLQARIKALGDLVDALAAARSDAGVRALVDHALGDCEGCAQEDDDYEADF